MNIIPNGTIIQLLTKEQIDLSVYNDRAVNWSNSIYESCSDLGVIIGYVSNYRGFYSVRFENPRGYWSLHHTSFKILLPEELSNTLNI